MMEQRNRNGGRGREEPEEDLDLATEEEPASLRTAEQRERKPAVAPGVGGLSIAQIRRSVRRMSMQTLARSGLITRPARTASAIRRNASVPSCCATRLQASQ